MAQFSPSQIQLSQIQVKRIPKIKFSLFHFKQNTFLHAWNIIVEKDKDKCSNHLIQCLKLMKEFGEFQWSNGHYHKFIILARIDVPGSKAAFNISMMAATIEDMAREGVLTKRRLLFLVSTVMFRNRSDNWIIIIDECLL